MEIPITRAGLCVCGYTLEAQDPTTKAWSKLPLNTTNAGLTIGSKAYVMLAGLSNAAAVRFRCTDAIAANDEAFGAELATFSLHKLVHPPSVKN